MAARSTYPRLPIILLATAAAAQHAAFMPPGVTLLRLPLAEGALLATVAELLPGGGEWDGTPPDVARERRLGGARPLAATGGAAR
jgi:hypothetical protein